MTTMRDLLIKHGAQVQWTFTTYYCGVHHQSPRVFDTIEEALRAIVDKLGMHALDHEYPMISLVPIHKPTSNGDSNG